MKFNFKFLFPIFVAIVIGFLFGKVIFNEYNNTLTVTGEGKIIYFIQSGIFSNMDDINKKYLNTDNILILKKDNTYYTYFGMSLNKKIATRIKEYYEDKGYNIYIEKQLISNEDFTTSLVEYDKILNISNDDKDIEIIEKVVISSYKELVVDEY